MFQGGNSKFEFNSVISNKASSTSATSAGLICNSVIPAAYNMVFNNSLGLLPDPQIVACDPEKKSLRAEPSAGAGFKNPNANDYHLTANTPVEIRDVADCPQGVAPDIDGDIRPQGIQCDLGADEYKP